MCYFFNGCLVFLHVHDHDRFNQPSLDRHIGCTNIFAIISNAKLNILVCLCARVESEDIEVEWLGLWVCLFLGLISITKLLSKNAQPKLFSHQK